MIHCGTCGRDLKTVQDVRGCNECHRNGTAALVHARHDNLAPIEDAMADGGGLPFVVTTEPALETDAQPPEPARDEEPAKKARKKK